MHTKSTKSVTVAVMAATAAVVVALAVYLVLWGTGYFRYAGINKNKFVTGFVTPENQTVVTVGTIHRRHYEKRSRYSIPDIASLLQYVNPDAVFIECRPEIFDEYGVLDGPSEMLFIASWCRERGIPVHCVDWWHEDNTVQANTTTVNRDNHIFANIVENMTSVKPGETVLIFYGTQHFYDQQPRMKAQGWIPVVFGNPAEYFTQNTENFTYPAGYAAELEKKRNFESTIGLERIDAGISDPKVHDAFYQNALDLCEWEQTVQQMVQQGMVYWK